MDIYLCYKLSESLTLDFPYTCKRFDTYMDCRSYYNENIKDNPEIAVSELRIIHIDKYIPEMLVPKILEWKLKET